MPRDDFNFRAFFWLAALLGAWSITQAVRSYQGVPEVKNAALLRNDPVSVNYKDVLCNTPPNTNVTIADAAILSALAYPAPQSGLMSQLPQDWQRVSFDADARAALLPADWNNNLYFEVWENAPAKAAVIAFRGTQTAADWHSNFHWLAKYLGIRTYYQKVNVAIPKLAAQLRKKLGTDVQIIATGHSLGGGLAQHALYSSADITRAIVFNATPVTGWHDLDADERTLAVKKNRIFRIHESHEALEFFRYLMRFEYSLNPGPNKNPIFWEYRFNLVEKGNPLETHEMSSFAKGLADIAAQACNI